MMRQRTWADDILDDHRTA